jgi:transposase InsO family protein
MPQVTEPCHVASDPGLKFDVVGGLAAFRDLACRRSKRGSTPRPGRCPRYRGDRAAHKFTSWAFSERVKGAGLALSMGRVGDAYDNPMMEAFWGRMQTELLNLSRWRTRLELANAIFEYLEVFHNRKRRHSALGTLTPSGYETLYHHQQAA